MVEILHKSYPPKNESYTSLNGNHLRIKIDSCVLTAKMQIYSFLSGFTTLVNVANATSQRIFNHKPNLP